MEFINIITDYFLNLQWDFIITFIMIAGFITRDTAISFLPEGLKKWLIKVPKIWRVLVVGTVYAFGFFHFRGFTKFEIETMFNSVVFAIVFHQALWKHLYNFFTSKLPNQTP